MHGMCPSDNISETEENKMKKLLFASTALIATAGVAAAEVKFGGYGRFGLGYVEDRDATNDEISDTILVSRFRLNIDGITETDGGVKFQARVRLQADENADTGEADVAKLNGAQFSVSYGGLEVVAGNTAGAIDNLSKYYGTEPGLEGFAGQYSGVDYGFLGYATGNTGDNAVYFNYAVGDFAVAASYDQRTETDGGDRWDASLTYTFGNITAAVAHGQTDAGTGNDDPSLTVLTLHGGFGDLAATLFVADDNTEDKATDDTAYGLSAAYTLGATTLQFAYGDGNAENDTQWIAVGAHYDLGGGASLRGGIGRKDSDSGEDKMHADFGAHFAF